MKISVLIVDDEEHILEELTYVLSKYTDVNIVGSYTSGEDALKAIVEYSPDVVILDIEMPKLNGIELARILQKNEISPHIIYLTAYENYAVDAFDVGAKGYILKPFSDDDIANHLEKAKKEIYKNNIIRDKNNFNRKIKENLIYSCLFQSDKGNDEIIKDKSGYLNVDVKNLNVCILIKLEDKKEVISDSRKVGILKKIDGILGEKENTLVGFIKDKIIAVFIELEKSSNYVSNKKKVIKICERIFKNINKLEGLASCYGVSTLNLEQVSNIKKYYKEANQALSISIKKNEPGKVVFIDELSLELLFNSIPEETFQKFVENILSNNMNIEILRTDKILLETIEQFLLNNLNSSETSRALFIHRNTLNYRLDKIMKITGKDPRILDNAMELKILLWYIKRISS